MRSLLVVLLLGLVAVAAAHQASLQPSLLEKKAKTKDAPMEEHPAPEEPTEEINQDATQEPVIASKADVIHSVEESHDKKLLKDMTTAPKVTDPSEEADETGMIVGAPDAITQEEAEDPEGEVLSGEEVTERGAEIVESVLEGDPDPLAVKCEFRVRKEWRSMKPEKQKIFLEAVQALKEEGTYDELVQIYHDNVHYSHGGSGFLPWNRKFLLKFEHALRDLGGKYACITLPYWDWSQDSGDEHISGIFCDELGFGKLEKGCIQSGPFADWRDPNNGPDEAKITREPMMPFNVAGPASIEHAIATFKEYGQTCGNVGIRQILEGTVHANPLRQIGGTIAGSRGPADPVWFLMHSYIDYLWSMWQDCHDYDLVNKEDITCDMYAEQNYDTDDGKNVDATLDASMPGFGDAATPRNMHNIAELGYGYAPCPFTLSQSFHDSCNWNWLVQEEESSSTELIEVASVKGKMTKHKHTSKAEKRQKAVAKAFAKVRRTAHKSLSKTQNDLVTTLNECFEEELVNNGNDIEQAMLEVVRKECSLLPEEEDMCEEWVSDNFLHKCEASAAEAFPTLCKLFLQEDEPVDYMSEEDEELEEYMEESGIPADELTGNEDVIGQVEYQVVSN